MLVEMSIHILSSMARKSHEILADEKIEVKIATAGHICDKIILLDK
jgi:hypothetical protein